MWTRETWQIYFVLSIEVMNSDDIALSCCTIRSLVAALCASRFQYRKLLWLAFVEFSLLVC